MLFGNRGARSSGTRQRKGEAFQPRGEALEPKVLLALLQLGAGTPKNIAGITTTAPAGPQTHGGQSSVHRRFVWTQSGPGHPDDRSRPGRPGDGQCRVAGRWFQCGRSGGHELDGSNDFLIGAPTVTQTGSVISPGTGTTSQAFLVFGNRSVTLPKIQSWLSSTPEQRVGVLAQPRQPAARPTHSRIAVSPTITTLTGSPSSPAPLPVLNSVPSSPPPAPTPSSSVLPTTPAAAVSTTSWPPRASTPSQHQTLRSTSTPPRLTRG